MGCARPYPILKWWKACIGLKAIDFNKIQFGVEVHELGFEKFSIYNARIIANNISHCIEVDKEVEQAKCSFARNKFEVNVDSQVLAANLQGDDRCFVRTKTDLLFSFRSFYLFPILSGPIC